MEDQKLPLILAAVVLALSGAAWLYMNRSAPVAPAPVVTAPAPAPAAPAEPLPLLDDSDAFASTRAQSLFSQPVPPPWLQADRLIRRITAAAFIVADGGSPRDSLKFLRPRGVFLVKRVKGRVYVDPKAYQRYDAVGDAAAALDAPGAAKLVERARPLFQQACAELDASCDIRDALIRSAKLLLDTPVVAGDIRLREKVLTWEMVDPRLEKLRPAQKHLLRLGPRNEALVQAKLRELALALGASQAELPQPAAYATLP